MSALEAVTAAGGVIFKTDSGAEQPEVVLIFRRGVWDLPKGKLEEGESIRDCAVREVVEEVGISEELQVTAGLGDTYHEYEHQGSRYGKTTHWFAMKLPISADSEFHPQIEEDIEKVEWYSLEDARKLVGYQNLLNVLDSFEKWYNERP